MFQLAKPHIKYSGFDSHLQQAVEQPLPDPDVEARHGEREKTPPDPSEEATECSDHNQAEAGVKEP